MLGQNKTWLARIARIDVRRAAITLTPRPESAGEADDIKRKGWRLLLRGDPGFDPLGILTARLDQVRQEVTRAPSTPSPRGERRRLWS